MITNMIWRLNQGDPLASTYTTDFCLLTSNIPLNEVPLMDQFHYELHNDVNDLLLTFHEEPKSLT